MVAGAGEFRKGGALERTITLEKPLRTLYTNSARRAAVPDESRSEATGVSHGLLYLTRTATLTVGGMGEKPGSGGGAGFGPKVNVSSPGVVGVYSKS